MPSMDGNGMNSKLKPVAFAASLLLLLLLTASFRLFSPGARSISLLILLPIPELILVTVLLILSRRDGFSWLGWFSLPLLGGLLLWNGGESFYRFFYRENFSPLSDLQFVGGLSAMLTGSDFWMSRAGGLLLGLLLLSVVLLLGFLLSRRLMYISAGLNRKWIPGLLLAALLQIVLIPEEVPAFILAGGAPERVSPAVYGEEPALAALPAAAPQAEVLPSREFALPGIADEDVHIFIIESYGHTLFTNPAHREVAEELYPLLERELQSQGWAMRSGFMRSPAFGGRSWLADASILTGIQIDDQQLYDSLPASGGRNLTHLFEDAGYFRLLAAPGTRQADDQWRNYYRFDRYLFRYDFDYRGPFVSFGAMPDQFLLYRSGRLLEAVESPIFAVYTLVSSHVPFEVIPEYVPDWELLGDGTIFEDAYLRRFNNNWLSGNEYPEGYIAGITYSLKSIAGYLNRYVDDDALAVIIGDHQPRIPISERSSTYSVPVHFLSRRPELLAQLPDDSLSAGFIPQETEGEHPDMAELAFLLRDLARGRAEPGASRAF